MKNDIYHREKGIVVGVDHHRMNVHVARDPDELATLLTQKANRDLQQSRIVDFHEFKGPIKHHTRGTKVDLVFSRKSGKLLWCEVIENND